MEGRVYDLAGPERRPRSHAIAGRAEQVAARAEDGSFRFRAFEGDGVLTVRLPQGRCDGRLTKAFGPALRGNLIRADFPVRAARVLPGRPGGLPAAGKRAAFRRRRLGPSDARGRFTLVGFPRGVVEVRLEAPPLRGRVELPAGPADVSRDVALAVPSVSSLRVRAVPNDSEAPPDGRLARRQTPHDREIASIERLAALANLDAGSGGDGRAAGGCSAGCGGRGAPAAYLAGPALVPRERVLFGVTELARAGQLELILARVREPGIR